MKQLNETVKLIVQSCAKCQQRKTMTTKTKEVILPQVSRENFESIYMDFCGPFRKTVHGKQYILAIVDHFSKLISLTAVAHQDEKTAVKVLLENWIYKYGPPKEIHVDRGKVFESKTYRGLADEFRINVIFSSPYHHRTNGVVERQFRTIRDAIVTSMQDGKYKDWTEILPRIEYMINNTYQDTIKMSPSEIVFGKKTGLFWKSRNSALSNIENSKSIKNDNFRKFDIGDQVWIKRENSRKDENRFEGPGYIIDKIHDRSFVIKLNNKEIIRNIEWLKPLKTRGMLGKLIVVFVVWLDTFISDYLLLAYLHFYFVLF